MFKTIPEDTFVIDVESHVSLFDTGHLYDASVRDIDKLIWSSIGFLDKLYDSPPLLISGGVVLWLLNVLNGDNILLL